MMASCSDLTKFSSFNNRQPLIKATPVPIPSNKKLVEPFNRLKNRANLFRRRNYSSQLDISDPRSSLPADHFILPQQTKVPEDNNQLLLKRSNSMICPQQRLQSLLKNSKKNTNRSSVCVELADCPTDESSTDDVSSLPNHNNEQTSATLVPAQLQKHTMGDEQRQQSSLPCDDSNLKRRSIEESFYDCKQPTLPEISSTKLSACTMTGKSLINLDESFSLTSSEDKCIQTTFNDTMMNNNHHSSTTSLSSSSTSIQTDSLENKSTISNNCPSSSRSMAYHPRTNIHERLINEEICIYWVNYLGSTAVKISTDNTPAMPTQAINRLKQSTQYASVLPVIGLSISPRGVEFLKHAKERAVICFHDIKSIHCACQDQDLRYFAYVTREQRLVNGLANPTGASDRKQHQSQSVSINADYHNYCHVFVVKSESMSTEILLTFGQAFDIAYQVHRRLNLKQHILEKSQAKVDANHKPEKMMLLSTHSPTTSASSSSSDEQRAFI
ncbi:unnamed protein product [Adineta ricciae]|uniref:PID domain-containing protein n=1 Tax=Adineta ricciae TaxID=249248 RepID=A0A813QQH0_ADIRI|nr:unnamed protein product [Adineta ricciae]CAF1261673.1 unnamed protein product [Adineta ricciae]